MGRMPNGHAHDAVTWFCVTPVAGAAWLAGHDGVGTAIATTSFVFAGLMFSGDLDLPSSQYRRWGRFRWIWKPYQWLVPHRSVISHGLILGPLGRLVYLMVASLVLAALALRLFTGEWAFPWQSVDAARGLARGLSTQQWLWVGYAFAGLWLGGASHSLVDWGWSALKRRR